MGIGGAAPPSSLLKSPREIDIMARGGAILHAALQTMAAAVTPGMSTAELDAIGEAFIRSHPGAEPAFKGLYGFPASACISLNEEIVHGIPSPKRILKAGDIITVDIGVFYGGFHTDSAWTYAVGEISPEARRLMDVTEQSLYAAIRACTIGNHIGDLGALANDVGYLPTASYCGRIRGDALNMTAVLCGNRFGRGLIRHLWRRLRCCPCLARLAIAPICRFPFC
jgi:methionyl aminopeptidase